MAAPGTEATAAMMPGVKNDGREARCAGAGGRRYGTRWTARRQLSPKMKEKPLRTVSMAVNGADSVVLWRGVAVACTRTPYHAGRVGRPLNGKLRFGDETASVIRKAIRR